jgi:6-pyruvoyltetrahydropterin/6-carboxytetrahydropterin synthase
MAKITVTKEFSWDMAHMLSGHEGLCKNLHGHTYKMQVEVSSKGGSLIEDDKSSKGMIIDFKNLKEIVRDKIIDRLDHAFLYWTGSGDVVEHKIAELLKESGRKVAEVPYRPTAEEMVIDFYNILFVELGHHAIIVESIKLWETPTSFAEVRGE